jgi:trimeric autotransporter adhesin
MQTFLRPLTLCAVSTLLICAPLRAQSPVLLELQNAASADRLVVDSAGGIVARGTLNAGAIPATGTGTRLMWYPRKAAFRAGHVTDAHWDDVSIGLFSTATGRNVTASGNFSTAMGHNNQATGQSSTAMGQDNQATGSSSTALGSGNTAEGWASVAIGWFVRATGDYSTAMGSYASTNFRAGAFVYGDASTDNTISASVANQFSVRAAGGVRFFTNSTLTSGATLAAGGGTWSAVSDRARKEHFLAVDGGDVLARIRTLPITTWRYLAEEDRTVRHIGPMAQDWHRAFGFSADSLHINSGDLDGVNLAGVQALDRRDQSQQAEIDALRRENGAQDERIRSLEGENEALRARLERIESMLSSAAPRP